jgi:hypothetical protein
MVGFFYRIALSCSESFVGMRVEWAKSQARCERWNEELMLVVEEMRRIPWYMEWKAQWWEQQATRRFEDGTVLLDMGCRAYAAKQAHICRSLGSKFRRMWKPLLDEQNCVLDWPPCSDYSIY